MDFLELTKEELYYYKYGSLVNFRIFILDTIKEINTISKFPKNKLFKILLYKIYIKYESNAEIFNMFLPEIIELFTTAFNNDSKYNAYNIVYINFDYLETNIGYLDRIYENNKYYIGVFIDIVLSYLYYTDTFLFVLFKKNYLHCYFSFNNTTKQLLKRYNSNIYNDYNNKFIVLDTKYNFFDFYNNFKLKQKPDIHELIMQYKIYSYIRHQWLIACIRFIIYK